MAFGFGSAGKFLIGFGSAGKFLICFFVSDWLWLGGEVRRRLFFRF